VIEFYLLYALLVAGGGRINPCAQLPFCVVGRSKQTVKTLLLQEILSMQKAGDGDPALFREAR